MAPLACSCPQMRVVGSEGGPRVTDDAPLRRGSLVLQGTCSEGRFPSLYLPDSRGSSYAQGSGFLTWGAAREARRDCRLRGALFGWVSTSLGKGFGGQEGFSERSKRRALLSRFLPRPFTRSWPNVPSVPWADLRALASSYPRNVRANVSSHFRAPSDSVCWIGSCICRVLAWPASLTPGQPSVTRYFMARRKRARGTATHNTAASTIQ